MTQNESSAVMRQRREPHHSLDDFPTPPWGTRALLEFLINCSAQRHHSAGLGQLRSAKGRRGMTVFPTITMRMPNGSTADYCPSLALRGGGAYGQQIAIFGLAKSDPVLEDVPVQKRAFAFGDNLVSLARAKLSDQNTARSVNKQPLETSAIIKGKACRDTDFFHLKLHTTEVINKIRGENYSTLFFQLAGFLFHHRTSRTDLDLASRSPRQIAGFLDQLIYPFSRAGTAFKDIRTTLASGQCVATIMQHTSLSRKTTDRDRETQITAKTEDQP